MRRWLPLALKLLLGGGLLAFVLVRIGLPSILGALQQIRPSLLAAALGGLVLMHLLHAVGLWLMVRGVSVSFGALLTMGVRAWVWGMITPARIGEISLVYYLSGHGMRLGSASALVLLDRVVTLLVLGLLSLGAALVLDVDVAFLGILGTVLLIVAVGVTLASWARFSSWIGTYLHRRLAEPLELLSATLRESLSTRPLSLLGFLLAQVSRILVQCGMTFVLFIAAGRSVGFLEICLVSALTRLAAIVPISVNGLGVREGLMVVLFDRLFGVEPAIVAAVAIWLNVLLYVSALVVYLVLPPVARPDVEAATARRVLEE